MAKDITEPYAYYPNLSIVFAGNRKPAREWTYPFFSAITARHEDTPHRKVSEVVARYGTPSEAYGKRMFIY